VQRDYLTLEPLPFLEVLEAALPFFLKILEVLGLPSLTRSATVEL
jgi:hypothetical protein|tara:strand:+ start:1011 stop:1145 length:135 start_codon:yes stop_codon:yes gene_type:complete